ncbi:MAG TPA: hypothetical protein VI455_11760 [Terriglobia bacterium]
MARPVNAILCCLLLTGAPLGAGPPRPESGVHKVSLTRVVRIPVVVLNAQGTATRAGAQDVRTLMFSPGAVDELPEGPDGFDVLDDGNLLITDPLRDRVAVFDAEGAFRQEWKIGFAADGVTVLPSGVVLVREANSGQLHAFDQEGNPRSSEGATLPEREEARLLSATSGLVMRPGAGGGQGRPINIQFDKPGSRLLSLESLGTDREGNTYVALEATGGGEAVDVNKYVRRYAADGKLAAEIGDIPLDYYVRPVDELRVHKGIVYQLMTTSSEVHINVWDTN